MFYSDRIEIYASLDGTPVKVIYADVQPYSGTANFDYGLSLELTNRVFCDITNEINTNAYLKIDGVLYKVLGIKTWSNYMEVYLYRCKQAVI